MPKKILVLTRYESLGASSRVRFLKFIPQLERLGFEPVVEPFLSNQYLEDLYRSGERDLRSVVHGYLKRLNTLLARKHVDAVWLEKEFLPWMPHWLERLLWTVKVPIVVDYDDPIFHTYDQCDHSLFRLMLRNKIPAVMRDASVIVAGNSYIADFARQAGARRVEILPSCVDIKSFPAKPRVSNKKFRIGWIGTPSSFRYLEYISGVLSRFCHDYGAELFIIGTEDMGIKGIPTVVRRWTEEKEADYLAEIDVGILPLIDEPWARGKCGYKAMQYMAAGRPIVVSPSAANSDIVETSGAGFVASTDQDWYECLHKLYLDQNLAIELGEKGRKAVVERYSTETVAPLIASIFDSVIKNKEGV